MNDALVAAKEAMDALDAIDPASLTPDQLLEYQRVVAEFDQTLEDTRTRLIDHAASIYERISVLFSSTHGSTPVRDRVERWFALEIGS